ncbi:hypothetical protein [uncultured Sulfitobacter sp.]|uniref:hypothetical protein n=1 Tax=uncultured Sulfitobacter sp. TaxID=191468 RepID=UPI0026061735|nr:hypothetical protein [uncultured Sulfitobacter sp.]
MPEGVIAEAFFAGVWVEVSIEQALQFDPKPLLRCAECHGRVFAHKDYADGAAAAFAHKAAHSGCSTKSTFDGVQTRHPDAIG